MNRKSTYAILISLLVLYLAIPLFSSSALQDLQINPFDYARITDVDYKAVVQDESGKSGSVYITERLTFDIHAASKNNLYWELWRDLPEDNGDGGHVGYTIHSVKQILEDGTEIVYEESPKLYWEDYDYVNTNPVYGPGKWYHSKGPYNESRAQYECVFFYVDGLYREEVVFEIEYEMLSAARRYGDCSDLYLSLYSGGTIRHLDSFRAQILIPDKDMPSPENYTVHTYGTNANTFPITESADANPGYYTFSFDLGREELKFRPYNEYLEFDLVSFGPDRHIFTDYAYLGPYSDDNVLEEIQAAQQAYLGLPEKFRGTKTGFLLLCAAASAAVIFFCHSTVRRVRKKYTFYKPSLSASDFLELPGDLDPNFAAFLVFCRQKPRQIHPGVYPALLLSLARKDYIRIENLPHDDARITITMPSLQAAGGILEPLSVCEAYCYNLLVRCASGGSILMSELQRRISRDYANTGSFVKNLYHSIVNIGITGGYFQKADYAEPCRYFRARSTFLLVCGASALLLNLLTYFTRLDFVFGGFFLLGAVCLAAALFLRLRAGSYLLLTQFGEDEYAKWRGFYRFLKSGAFRRDSLIAETSVGEKYLVYAAAFGLSSKKLDTITLKCPEVPETSVLRGSYYRSRRFRRYGRSFHSSGHSGFSGHSSFSGGSGGFGFGRGGGGRGGGGGGGGH